MMTKNQIMAKVLFSNNLATREQVQELWNRIDESHDIGMLLLEMGALDRPTYDAVNAYVKDLEVKLAEQERAKEPPKPAPTAKPVEPPKPAPPAKAPEPSKPADVFRPAARPSAKPVTPVANPSAPSPVKAPAKEEKPEPALEIEGNNPYGQTNVTSVQIEKVEGLEQTSIAPVAIAQTAQEAEEPPAKDEEALPDRFEIESGEGSVEIPESLTDKNSLSQILAFARSRGATDVYLSEKFPIAFRIFGQLTYANDSPFDASRLSGFLSEAKSGFADGYEPAVGVDFSKSFALSGAGRSRLTVTWNETVPSLAIRLISAESIPFEKLYLPAFCADFLKLSGGLVLIAGPSGSGRTTTLGAIAEAISSGRNALVETIEKPIERLLQGSHGLLIQKEVGLHVHSGASAVREAVLSGARVILFDSIESVEELWALLRASSAGVLVFAATTGNDIYGLLSRLLGEAGDREDELASALANELKGIVVQHLVPVIDNQGWVLAVEAMKMTSSTLGLIRKRELSLLSSALSTSRNQGVSLDDSLQNLVDSGFIRGEEAWRRSLNRRRFAAYRPTNQRKA